MEQFVIRMEGVCSAPVITVPTSFSASSGEMTAIVGNNGEGKTGLVKILAGILPRTAGAIWLNEDPLDIHSISSAHRAGIYLLQETLQLFPGKSIMDNLLLGNETLIFHNHIWNPSRKRREQLCRSILEQLGLNFNLHESIDHLGQGEKCMIQIGRVLLCNPRILIMDEFSASLTNCETERVMKLLDGLRQKGICIILISHKYSSVVRFCDHLFILEKGSIAKSFSRKETGDENFLRQVHDLGKGFAFPRLPHKPGKELLIASHISSGILRDVSFSLSEGEMLGIAGVVGSGRTTLIRAISRDLPLSGGSLVFHPGLDGDGAISVLPGDCSHDAIFPGKDLTFNITVSDIARGRSRGLLSTEKLDIFARDYMNRLRIQKDSCRVRADHLSQGEQKKILIARALYQHARLYIFDEPSSNLDPASRNELYNIYNALLASGASIILISSEFSELTGMCDHILLLKEGEQVGLYPAAQITTDFLYSVL